MNFTLTDSDKNTTVVLVAADDISSVWGGIEASITVPMGSTLTGVEVVTTPNANYVALESEDNRIETNYNVSNLNNTIDIKNPKLTLTSYPESEERFAESKILQCADGTLRKVEHAVLPRPLCRK